MLPDLSLCRFHRNGSGPRLGLIRDGQLYDLTALGEPAYADLGAWLVAASGRAKEALATLEAAVADASPVAAAEALLAGEELGLLAPIDRQEVWACGVTYEMSRAARMRESEEPTIYGRVYDAERPEIFFKATAHRVVGHGEAVAIRADSDWDVPEAELTLVVTPAMEIVGYTIGNDMSSRDIEGENPLYLPQAKVYDRSCALGPVVRLAAGFDPLDLAVTCTIERGGERVFEGQTHTRQIHRSLEELVHYIGRCNSFPEGVLVMTGTGVVPPDTFTLQAGDVVHIAFEGLGALTNSVIELPAA
jgi:2-dehydro-3-deoxy-D-arabinonate dehydratase